MNISDYVNNPLIQKLSAILLTAAGILLIVLSLHKSVLLVVNGEIEEVETLSVTVSGLLKDQEIILTGNDRIDPSPNTFLWGNERVILTHSTDVQVQADGELITLFTAERDPSNILLEAGVSLFPKDRILVDGMPVEKGITLSHEPTHIIQVLRGTPVELEIDQRLVQFVSDANTLVEALWKEGIQLYEADLLTPPPGTVLDGSPVAAKLIRSKPYQVQIADQDMTIRTTAETVGAALAGAGLALQGMDYSIPPEGDPLPESDPVELIRVREEILLDQEQNQFSSEYQAANDLDLDQLQIVSGGEYGLKAKQLRILYENGKEVSREVEKEWTIKEPKPRLIGYGTRISLKTADTDHGQITYWRKITAYATSYDSTCPGCDTITASGTVLKKGTIAVTLDWYRYMKGAKVYIPGYGFGTIEDVGGGVPWSTNWVDLGYKKGDFVPWSQNVTVYFLAPAPPPENIMYVLY